MSISAKFKLYWIFCFTYMEYQWQNFGGRVLLKLVYCDFYQLVLERQFVYELCQRAKWDMILQHATNLRKSLLCRVINNFLSWCIFDSLFWFLVQYVFGSYKNSFFQQFNYFDMLLTCSLHTKERWERESSTQRLVGEEI